MAGTGQAPESDSGEIAASEWDPDQRLLYEKEVLGFYLSGHPLKRVWQQALRLGAVAIGQLGTMPDGARVMVCGLVGALREINTKNGNRMGFATLEDVDGTMELTVFPDAFRQSVNHLRSGVPLLVRGRVEGAGTVRKLLAEEIRPLPAEGEGDVLPPHSCRVRVPAGAAAYLAALREICDTHQGPASLFLHLDLDGTEVVLRSRTIRVRASPGLVGAVERLLGARSSTFEA